MQFVQVELDPATVELAQCEPFDETPREFFSIPIIFWLESLKSHIPWTMVYNRDYLLQKSTKIKNFNWFGSLTLYTFPNQSQYHICNTYILCMRPWKSKNEDIRRRRRNKNSRKILKSDYKSGQVECTFDCGHLWTTCRDVTAPQVACRDLTIQTDWRQFPSRIIQWENRNRPSAESPAKVWLPNYLVDQM